MRASAASAEMSSRVTTLATTSSITEPTKRPVGHEGRDETYAQIYGTVLLAGSGRMLQKIVDKLDMLCKRRKLKVTIGNSKVKGPERA